ncbi:DNA cytosine methyltransferase [Paenibacillus alkaliterrae]
MAAEWAGINTVAFCEKEPFAQSVLRRRFPERPIYEDVFNLTREVMELDGIADIDIVAGGFPCQPFSHAGRRTGTNDDRYLWPEMCRVIGDVRPSWVFAENVDGLVSMAQSNSEIVLEDETTLCEEAEMVLETIRKDLEEIGYQSVPVVVPAAGIGAMHRRYRIFILGYTKRSRRSRESRGGQGRSLRTDMAEWKAGLWPTPRANDAEKHGEIANDPRNGLPAAALWGTPTASSCKGSSPYGSDRWEEELRRGNIKGQVMEPNNKGQLNPDWVETLMNFPIGWTDGE